MSRFVSFVCFLLLASVASADDAYIRLGGSPKLMATHPSIRMVRERVVIDLQPQKAFRNGYHVEATFEFRNEGPACQVQMGFPGGSAGDVRADRKRGSLPGFRSWVDGKAVPVRYVVDPKDPEGKDGWYVKTVAFAKGATRRVRVAYDGTGGFQSHRGVVHTVDYTFHTGASWRGPIGTAELVVRVPKTALEGRLRPFPSATERVEPNWPKLASGAVQWRGFAKPTVHGREMRFVRRRFEPTEADDLHLAYGYRAFDYGDRSR